MVARRSPARTRMLQELGTNITRWRKLQGLSASQLALRAHVTRETLRNIETGTGTPKIDSLLAVLTSLGMANTVVASSSPWNSTAGRALMDEHIGMADQPLAPAPAGRSVSPRPNAPFQHRIERVTYELHRAVAKRLIEDSDAVISRVPEQVERMRPDAVGGAHALLDEWIELTHASVGDIINVMLADDEHAKEMRQMSPFIGVLPEEERLEAIARAAGTVA
ncbi:helix-turn-helix domain-containing protein [Microterricola viridarii]|uniref:Helix-turn-helix n=1 Tax=Microterricola viridarii TaxID=412690 RepID=A0A1H1T4I5_9MICO|nr:helix-turn-helix transcriptional regulator [Microterricola viridarii]SDS54926.1 Helix-turn-helix [Microterricola viridarii]